MLMGITVTRSATDSTATNPPVSRMTETRSATTAGRLLTKAIYKQLAGATEQMSVGNRSVSRHDPYAEERSEEDECRFEAVGARADASEVLFGGQVLRDRIGWGWAAGGDGRCDGAAAFDESRVAAHASSRGMTFSHRGPRGRGRW